MRGKLAVGRVGEGQREGRSAEQENVRLIVERLADGVVIVDRAGQIRFVNPAAEAMFGREARELTGAQFGFPLVPRETTEIDVVHPERGTTAVELRATEIRWGDEPALLVSLRDVTDRKEAEEKARQLAREQLARAEAEAANEAKSAFLATMSHELRTPLNAIIGYVDLLDLELGGPLTEQQRQQLGRIRASGQHLLALVSEILDLARVEAGHLTVDRSRHRATDAAEAALVLIQPQVEEHGLSLSRAYDTTSGGAYVGDEDRVRQILVNLLSNAVKFTEPGGRIALEVFEAGRPDPEAQLHDDGPWVAFRVTDTGIGIAPDQIDAVFAPFVQVEGGHTRTREGSGLGLTISRRLARLMGGDLTARSRVGEGSAFTLWLPAARGEQRAPDREGVALSGSEPRVEGLAEIGRDLLGEIGPVLDAFVARLRSEAVFPGGTSLAFAQLADHVGALLADTAGSLVILEDASGEPTSLLADGSEIQRFIAERHGTQRARLGWTTDALRREHAILREEIERLLRPRFPGGSAGRLDEALAVVVRLLAQAEAISLRAHERAAKTGAAGE